MNDTNTCPWCEGRGVTGRLVLGGDGNALAYSGILVPVVGLLRDQPCGECGGTGAVSGERHARLTVNRLP